MLTNYSHSDKYTFFKNLKTNHYLNQHSLLFQENETNRPLLRPNNYATTSRRTVTTDINGHTILNTTEVRTHDSCWVMLLHCLQGDANYRTFKSMTKSGTLSVSKIDSLARIIFPFSFICLNVLYWAGFLYYFWWFCWNHTQLQRVYYLVEFFRHSLTYPHIYYFSQKVSCI